MKNVLSLLACFALACFALFAVLGPFEVLRAFVVGWIVFLYHTLPRMTVDWPSVFVGCLALVLFTAGVHGIGRASRRGTPDGPPWKFRWSMAAVVLVFLLFASGIALVGIVHQSGWLLTSTEPYYVQTLRARGAGYSPNNLKQMGLAVLNYNSTYAGKGPPGGTFTPEGEMRHSWETYSIWCIGYTPREIDLNLPWDHPRNEKYFQCIIPPFINASLPSPPLFDDRGFGLSHYAANSRVLGPNKDLRLEEIRDGTAYTLLIGEVNADFKPWGHPVNWRDPAKGINRSPRGFGGSPSAGGASFCMADGSVRFVNERIDPKVLHALSTPDGGEEIDLSALPKDR